MLLVVHVDECETHAALYPGTTSAVARHARFATAPHATLEEVRGALVNLLGQWQADGTAISRSAVCSTSPAMARTWSEAARSHLGHPMLVVGPKLRWGIAVRPGAPAAPYRLANALAAIRRAGRACVIVDFGASTVFDVVSPSAGYLGGLVVPRAEAALAALCERTALLPRIELTVSPPPIGTSTAEALRSGAVYGFAGQVEAIIRRLKRELGTSAVVIATGRNTPPAESVIRQSIDEVEELLTLDGLRLVTDLNPVQPYDT
jgi:type III pantothenate kinase